LLNTPQQGENDADDWELAQVGKHGEGPDHTAPQGHGDQEDADKDAEEHQANPQGRGSVRLREHFARSHVPLSLSASFVTCAVRYGAF
jgi:hypothetical protein